MSRTLLSALLVAALTLTALPAAANPDARWSNIWYLPDHARVQVAGYTGLLAIGVGFSFADELVETDLLYGYLPEAIGGTAVHSLTLRSQIRSGRVHLDGSAIPGLTIAGTVEWVPLMFGLSATHLLNRSQTIYWSSPDRYPDGYYAPGITSLNYMVHLGTEIAYRPGSMSLIGRHGIYAEAVVLGSNLQAWAGNVDIISPGDIITFSAGYKLSW